jgi:hypothetical protein
VIGLVVAAPRKCPVNTEAHADVAVRAARLDETELLGGVLSEAFRDHPVIS